MHEHRVIVPNADRTALLTLDGRLPLVSTTERRQPDILAALSREHGVRAPFLRTVRRRDDDGRLTTLIELDAAPAGWSSRGAAKWLPLEAAEASAVVPVFADGVDEWLAEQLGASPPPERAPWARPGWLAQATAWVDRVSPLRAEPRLIRQWCLSAMYAFETAAGMLYLKACFALWRHEPGVTDALAREHRGALPDVVAIDADRGWLLMRELTGTVAADAGADWVAEQLRCAAELQRAWIGRGAELVTLGAPKRPLEQLAREAPELASLCDRLTAIEVPETITHGDLHKWNAFVEDDRIVLIDWSDAAVAHPFLDLAPALRFAEEPSRDRLLDAYLAPWGGLAATADLREAAALGEALGCVYQALSYRAIEGACEPADRWLWAGQDDTWLRRARELAAEL